MLLSAEKSRSICTRQVVKNFLQHTSSILNMSFHCKSVAVIGAGISGVVAAAHLQREGIKVTVLERSSAAGGIWYSTHRLCPSNLTDGMPGSTMSDSLWNRRIREPKFAELIVLMRQKRRRRQRDCFMRHLGKFHRHSLEALLWTDWPHTVHVMWASRTT